MSDIQHKIATLVGEHDIVLFMKGTPLFPQCGFSSTAIQILERLLNVSLLKRSSRSVELTHAGRAFLIEARRMVRLAENAALITFIARTSAAVFQSASPAKP